MYLNQNKFAKLSAPKKVVLFKIHIEERKWQNSHWFSVNYWGPSDHFNKFSLDIMYCNRGIQFFSAYGFFVNSIHFEGFQIIKNKRRLKFYVCTMQLYLLFLLPLSFVRQKMLLHIEKPLKCHWYYWRIVINSRYHSMNIIILFILIYFAFGPILWTHLGPATHSLDTSVL